MAFVGNLLWFIFGGGILQGTVWLIVGLIWCCTIIGIPIGMACFRIAAFAYFPFGKELVPVEMLGEPRITGTAIMNAIWIVFCGLWLSIAHLLIGLADLCTLIGIPFAFANFKLCAACFAPLGKRAVSSDVAKAARSRVANQQLDDRLAKK